MPLNLENEPSTFRNSPDESEPPSELREAFRREFDFIAQITEDTLAHLCAEAMRVSSVNSLEALKKLGRMPTREELHIANAMEFEKYDFPAIQAMERWEQQQELEPGNP